MIDLHTHILPGVDDGAGDLAESLAMCRAAQADGCTAMVATPHLRAERYWNGDRQDLETRFASLRAAVAEELGDDFTVHLGGEIAIHTDSLGEIDLLPGGDLLSLAGGSYLLLELDWRGLGPDPVEMVHEVVVAGFRPIIAHPERVAWLVRDRGLQHELVAHGALMQLTGMSVTGALGEQPHTAATWLLEQGLAHFVASDCHDPSLRVPGLSEARRHVARQWGEEVARLLVVDHPRAVLDDRPIDPAAMVARGDSGQGRAKESRSGVLSGLARKFLAREE